MKYYVSITSLFTIEANDAGDAARQALQELEKFPLSHVNDVKADRAEVDKFIFRK